MYAIIPAGGRGTRLHSITNDAIPKPMALIGKKPIIRHVVDGLMAHGVDNFIIAISHLGEQIVDYFGDGSKLGVNIQYLNSAEYIGALGAIKGSLEMLPDDVDASFMVGADIISDVNYTAVKRYHEQTREAGFTPLFTPVSVPSRFGTIESVITHPGSQPRFSRMLGKQTNDCLIFYMEKELAKFIPSQSETDFLKTLPIGDQNASYVHTGYFRDVGEPNELKAARRRSEYRVWKASSIEGPSHRGPEKS